MAPWAISGPRAPTGSATAGPISTGGFAGLTEAGACGGCEPPDPWVAVGPANIIQAVNTSIRISTRQGGALLTVPFASFFGEPPSQVGDADPRVLWDAAHARWLASELSFDCAAGHLYLAISGAADPTLGWTVYRFDFPGSLPDYPGLGTASDKVVLGTNEFAITPSGLSCSFAPTSSGATLDVIDWSALLGGGPVTASETGPDPSLFTWRPATALSATSILPAIVIESGTGDVGYATISGTVAAGTVNVSAVMDLTTAAVAAAFRTPPRPAGATAFTSATVDGRPTDALWQNGHLVFVSTYPCVPPGDSTQHDCVRATVLDTTTATPSRVEDTLLGYVGYDFFMGGIGLAADTTQFLVFSVSSSTAAISTYATAQLPGDPVNTYQPLALVKAGSTTYVGSRWGDYVGVAQDPSNPHAVWQGDEYPGAGGTWATWISQIDVTGSTYAPLTPARLLDTRFGTGLSGKFVANTPRTFQVTGLGGVPANAVGVTGNFTVTNQTAAGAAFLGPNSTASPATSTLNFPLGDSRANGVTLALSPTGTLSATYLYKPGATTDFIFDVTGYFVPDASGSTYIPLTPARLLDTRVGTGLSGKFSANTPRTFQVTGRGGTAQRWRHWYPYGLPIQTMAGAAFRPNSNRHARPLRPQLRWVIRG